MVINEFLPRPQSDWSEDGSINNGDEFIELMNMGATSINIKYWKLDNGANSHAYVLPDVTLIPRQILVFFHFETNLPLTDGGGTVRLVKSDGHTADIFNYPPVVALDRTWCRLSSGTGFLTFACPPTPGRPNIPFDPDPAASAAGLICALPDTVPSAMASAECSGPGGRIWNPPLQIQSRLPRKSKWEVFVE